jgi:hypothetical protein
MLTSLSVNGHFNCFDLDVHSLAWFSYLSPIFAFQVRGATVYRAPSKQTLSVVQASCPSPSVISGVWTPLPWSGSSSSMGVPLPRPWRGWASCPRPAEKSTCLEETVRTPWPVIFAHWQIPVTFPVTFTNVRLLCLRTDIRGLGCYTLPRSVTPISGCACDPSCRNCIDPDYYGTTGDYTCISCPDGSVLVHLQTGSITGACLEASNTSGVFSTN